MGGLRKKMPVTFWTFFIGTLALCGVPPLSGFYSKDSVLAAAYHGNVGLFAIGVIVSVLTTFYMFRLFFVAFLGDARSDAASHAHESPKVMTLPLQFLTVLSVVGGLIGINHYVAKASVFPAADEHHVSWFAEIIYPVVHAPMAALFGLFAIVVGLTLAYTIYASASRDSLPEKLGAWSRAMRGRFYFDEIYSGLILITHEALSRLADAVDRWIIAGLLVRGAHGTTELLGRALRLVQTGNLQTYAFLIVAGVAVVLYYVLFR